MKKESLYVRAVSNRRRCATLRTLEDPNMREFATEDPLGFLATYSDKTIIDEAQRVPDLFGYLQGHVDASSRSGQYVLPGSQNFMLSEAVSQSLAGRVAVHHLLPLSRYELAQDKTLPGTLDRWLFAGGFPRIHGEAVSAQDYFPSCIETYLERDARAQVADASLVGFQRFLRLCAGRVG